MMMSISAEAPSNTFTTSSTASTTTQNHAHPPYNKNIVACTEYRSSNSNHSSSLALSRRNKTLSHIETIRFVIVDFMNLPQQQGEYFETQALEAHGFTWKLQIWPRGSSSEGFVSIYLACVDASSTKQAEIYGKIQFGPSSPSSSTSSSPTAGGGGGGLAAIVDDQIQQERYCKSFKKTFDNPAYSYSSQRIELHEIIDNCLELSTKNWIIDVDIQLYIAKATTTTTSVWYPPKVYDSSQNTHSNNNLPPPPPGKFLLESKLEADVLFKCTNNNQEAGEQDIKILHAHKCILVHRAPGLYEFIKDIPKGDTFDIPSDTPYEILMVLLEYIYVGTIPTINITTNTNTPESNDESSSKVEKLFAKRLLVASSRYCMILLKLHIESEICNKLLTPQTAADWLVFADAYCCALLKESCFELYSTNKSKIKASEGWPRVKESSDLLEELLDYYAADHNQSSSIRRRMLPMDSNDYNNMTIGMLRDKLLLKQQQQHQKHEESSLNNQNHYLEVLDGTRSMLIQRLKE